MSEESFTVRNAFDGEVGNVIQGGTVNVHNGPQMIVPREGPRVRPEWTGRESELASIGASLAEGRPVAVVGDAGIGKTALAAMAIDRYRDRYPRGQLYIVLDGEKVQGVLQSVLLRLNVSPSQIPSSQEGCLSLYHSVTRDQALLVAVDGVVGEREAALFRPASPTSGYVVASRVPLPDQDYRSIPLEPLAVEDAAGFLRDVCPNLAEDLPPRLVQVFGSKPADLNLLAGLIAHRSLVELVEVREVVGEGDLFTGVYNGLSRSARWLYRLLGAIPNREFEREVVGILHGAKGWDHEGVLGAFTELRTARLVVEHREGWHRIETTEAFERPGPTEPVPLDLFSAARDSLIWHVRRAQLADRTVMEAPLRFAPPLPGHITAREFNGRPEAMEWYRTLYPALCDFLKVATEQHWPDLAWALAEALWAYYANAALDHEAAKQYEAVLGITADPVARAQLNSMLAMCLTKCGNETEAELAVDDGWDAVAAAERSPEVPDRTCMALKGLVTEALGRLRKHQRRFDEAVEALRRSAEFMEAIGRPKAVGIRLRVVAEIYEERGELDLAVTTWELAATWFETDGDRRNRLGTLLDIAMLRFRRGDAGALARVDELLEDLVKESLWQTVAETHERVAAVLVERGEPHLDRAKLALHLFTAHGDVIGAERVRIAFGISEADGH
ncbi:hypothetical protein [Glycomyces tenuis]|uniref:hypothetical protein n=1 Tax=Glycomyces tenuis TaxID=58116 RepID=UPI00042292DF|nr:hypothetical protein [Glycomyces tenuis]